ncbi:hypothetical protein [Kitasatospora sp. DSM 101779]|uniref:hypothetical protein n=1 Tax=Kitasatospora sp. DSM 101779 TaxID=2853165 RepID=UPI0021D9869D|nr:hypothetical protein [Kitasatospora sp. DSM 101779]MCU7826963.1 hypothetical protein [Kitasatospora sp. DSM 101779]
MTRLLRTLPGARALAAAALAAVTLLPAGTAEAAAAPAPAPSVAAVSVINDGQHYVLAPQHAPDQWLGEVGWNNIVARASRLWYGNQYHHALWTARVNGAGAVELQNVDFGGSLQDDNGAVEANWGQGGTWDWTAVAGPGGTVALRNQVTGRYLALNAANVAVMATTAYFWYVVNAHM